MKKSSSFHGLNGDKELNFFQKKLYFIVNRINNSFPNLNVDPKIEVRDFEIKDIDRIYDITNIKNSPSRKLSDFFWHELNWKKIEQSLGKIKILDIGCGTGRYAESFIKFSKNSIHKYLGIDIYKDPKTDEVAKKYKNVKFEVFDGVNLKDHFKGVNLITTQSAFEHIPEDLNFFRQVAEYVKGVNYPVMQIHLIPSSACLDLYQLHGIRQYTPRTVSKITRLFGDESKVILYKLGGQNSVDMHYRYITKPVFIERTFDLRDNNVEAYSRETLNAIKKDTEQTSNPAFYALIIVSNSNTGAFE